MILLTATPCRLAAEANQLPAAMVEDADLHGVCFLDRQTGWAVGDRGAIWRTRDAGTTWDRVESPTSASLQAIDFANGKVGLIVGGTIGSYEHDSRGVILRTEDGGITWRRDETLDLPHLSSVAFIDNTRAYCVGYGSATHPSGIFVSHDAGRSWQTVWAANPAGWLALDVLRDPSPDRGLAVGSDGRVVRFDSRQGLAAQLPAMTETMASRPHGVAWIDQRTAVIVGGRGSAWLSHDGGLRWDDISPQLPAEIRTGDLTAVTAFENKIFVATAFPSRIAISPDLGRSWQFAEREGTIPIHDINMHDATHGWAVGALGTILATRDGGRSWHQQRGGGTQLAAVGIFARGEKVPWQAITYVTAILGGRVQIVLLDGLAETREAVHEPFDPSIESRVRHALVGLGGCGVDSWPEFPPGNSEAQVDPRRVIAHWQQLHTRQGAASIGEALLKDRIAAYCETWQPDLLLALGPEPSSGSTKHEMGGSIESLIGTAILDCQSAANGAVYWITEQSSDADYVPHDGISVPTNQIVYPQGMTVERLARHAAGQVNPRHRVATTSTVFHLAREPAQVSSNWLLTTRRPQAASGRFRPRVVPSDAQRAAAERATRERATIDALVLRAAQSVDNSRREIWARQAQIQSLVAGWDQADAAHVFFELAHCAFANGNFDAALMASETMQQAFPNCPVTTTIRRRAIQYICSAEIAILRARVSDKPVLNVPPANPEDSHRTVASNEPLSSAAPMGTGVANADLIGVVGRARRPYESISIDELIRVDPHLNTAAASSPEAPQRALSHETRPELWQLSHWNSFLQIEDAGDLATKFTIESHRRRHTGAGVRQKGVYQRLARTAGSAAWRNAAECELALLDPGKELPRPVYVCVAGSRPRLDGRLDERLWQEATFAPFQSVSADPILAPRSQARIAFATDSEFLFVAVHCEKEQGRVYAKPSLTRQRDEDLTRCDRVAFALDIDRDHSLRWHFAIDQRGCTREWIGDHDGWNPRWFVASDLDAMSWTVEAAIPLVEIRSFPVSSDEVWAISASRTVPGVGVQIWPPGGTCGWMVLPGGGSP